MTNGTERSRFRAADPTHVPIILDLSLSDTVLHRALSELVAGPVLVQKLAYSDIQIGSLGIMRVTAAQFHTEIMSGARFPHLFHFQSSAQFRTLLIEGELWSACSDASHGRAIEEFLLTFKKRWNISVSVTRNQMESARLAALLSLLRLHRQAA